MVCRWREDARRIPLEAGPLLIVREWVDRRVARCFVSTAPPTQPTLPGMRCAPAYGTQGGSQASVVAEASATARSGAAAAAAAVLNAAAPHGLRTPSTARRTTDRPLGPVNGRPMSAANALTDQFNNAAPHGSAPATTATAASYGPPTTSCSCGLDPVRTSPQLLRSCPVGASAAPSHSPPPTAVVVLVRGCTLLSTISPPQAMP